jgi:hypothetical protein
MEMVRNMKHFLILILLFALAVSAPLWAKGDMVLIEVKGAALPAPIRITDPKIEDFTPWAGPGVNGARVPNADGFIIDWHAGIVSQQVSQQATLQSAQPAPGLRHYEVSFYEGCRTGNGSNCLTEKPLLIYVVSYDYDPSSPKGFVYLPGKGDPSYSLNVGTITRRVEGNWFLATSSWEQFIRPVIAKAMSSRAALADGKQGCPVTTAPDPPFVPPPPFRVNAGSGEFLYGSPALWAVVQRHWQIHGFTGSKLPYFHQGYDWTKENNPRLTVVARRLDGSEPIVWASPANGAGAVDGATKISFITTGLEIPAAGCWEIVTHYIPLRGDSQTLTYTVWVEP